MHSKRKFEVMKLIYAVLRVSVKDGIYALLQNGSFYILHLCDYEVTNMKQDRSIF